MIFRRDRECANIATSQVGTRNDALNRASYNMHQLVAAGALTESEVHNRLFGAAIACGLVKDDGADAVLATIKSGATAGLRLPRTIPEQRARHGANGNSNGATHGDANRDQSPPRSGSELISRCAADIVPEKLDWLWPGRLARGKHTCIAGEPGTGKSQLLIAIIATLSSGGEWPCNEGRAPIGNAIILSAEDGAGDTIIPRLLAAGADLSRVHVISAVRNTDGTRRTLNLQNDLDLLEKKIGEIGHVALVGVDPVSSYLGKTDSHKNSEVRGLLEPFSEMAERMRVAIVSVTHFSKSGAGNTTKALHRFIGSIAFTGAPRAAFAVIEDAEHDGRRLFLHAKNNLARAPQGLAFRLEQDIVGDDIVASRVFWDAQPVAITANEALAADVAGFEGRTAKAEAKEVLQAVLAGQPVPAKEVHRIGREHGLTPKAIRSARKAIGVKIERNGFGPGSKSLWSLPKGA
jgi:putative DNA primase/helicase